MSAAVQQIHSAGNVLDLPSDLAGRNPITGENINEYAFVVMLRPFRLVLQEGRMILPDFREVLRKIRVSPCVLQDITFWRGLVPDDKKLFIVFSGHHQVDIIVPRDKSLMPHSTDQGAVGQRIPQTVLCADLMDHIQYFLLCCPDLPLDLI